MLLHYRNSSIIFVFLSRIKNKSFFYSNSVAFFNVVLYYFNNKSSPLVRRNDKSNDLNQNNNPDLYIYFN
ncbi:hypothetical protein ABIB50_005366 [Mucilaginibacter sp. UYCu711]